MKASHQNTMVNQSVINGPNCGATKAGTMPLAETPKNKEVPVWRAGTFLSLPGLRR
jgi:hypothetical protein